MLIYCAKQTFVFLAQVELLPAPPIQHLRLALVPCCLVRLSISDTSD